MITTYKAVKIILDSVKVKNISEEIYVSDSLDRVCFENIYSNIDIPSFTRSAMDGYAVVFKEGCNKYEITEEENKLKSGKCIRINTGFPVPNIADAVVEVEKTDIKDGFIIIKEKIEPERNFTKIGSELKKGELLVKNGEHITAKKRALLAYAGIVTLSVYQKPIIGIITTGDEVVFPSCNLPKHSVYNANFFILDGLLKKWGANCIYFGHIPDEKDVFKERLEYALERCDIVLTTGGVSKGTKDYTKDTLQNIGANILIDKSTIKPGKPAAFATYKDKYIFALPGWPAALYTVAYIYLKPFILKFSGFKDYENKFFEGILDEDMHSRIGKDYFNRVFVEKRNGNFYLKNTKSQKTDNFYSISQADGLVWLDTELEDKTKGSKLPFIFLDD